LWTVGAVDFVDIDVPAIAGIFTVCTTKLTVRITNGVPELGRYAGRNGLVLLESVPRDLYEGPVLRLGEVC